jgi:hypothetical protein
MLFRIKPWIEGEKIHNRDFSEHISIRFRVYDKPMTPSSR